MTRFSFTEEQEEFRAVLRRFMEDKSPSTEVRRLMETDEGWDPEVWAQLSNDLGLTAIHIPEARSSRWRASSGQLRPDRPLSDDQARQPTVPRQSESTV